MATTKRNKKTSGNGTREQKQREDDLEDRYYEDAYRAWGDLYQRMAADGMEFFQRSMQTAQEMVPGPEIHQDMYRHWNDSFTEFMNQATVEGKAHDPDTYRKLYYVWLDTWSRNFDTYMRTPEFIKSSGKNLEAMSDVKAQMGEMLEEYWHGVHLPSSRDMRELYHKLYIMERKLDEQDRKLDTLIEAMAQLAKSNKKTSKSK